MRSIRARLLLTLLTGMAIVLLVGGTVVYWIARTGLLRQFDAGLESRAHTIATLVKLEPRQLDPRGPIFGAEILDHGDAPEATMAETYFVIWSQENLVMKQSDNFGDMEVPVHRGGEGTVIFADLELPGGGSGRGAWLNFRPRVDEDDWEYVGIELADPQLLAVVAALDRSPVDAALASLLGALLAAGGAIGVTAGLLVVLGIRWGLAPLNRMSGQLAVVGSDGFSRRVDGAGAPRELVPVYRELNRMLDRVEETLERERTFADAAAHELRTPLAELRAAAEVALRWPDLNRADTALREALDIGREMERLVESLLLISRGNATSVDRSARRAPVASIARACFERAADEIGRKQLATSVELNGHDLLDAPADAVEIILNNLIDNAVHYTPAHGSIAVRAGANGNGAASLIVENGPVEMKASDVPRLFKPFWRREGSRSDRRHSGLGLAVVEHIAKAVGMSVDAVLHGDRLRIELAGSTSADVTRADPPRPASPAGDESPPAFPAAPPATSAG